MRSLILSTAALFLAAPAQSCIATKNLAWAKSAYLATAPYLFLGSLVLFILAFAKPLCGERKRILRRALLALVGLLLGSLAYFYLTQGERFLLAVACCFLSIVFLGGAFGQEQEDESVQGPVGGMDSRITATEGLLLLLAVASALLALVAWWRDFDPKVALFANGLSLLLFFSASWSLDSGGEVQAHGAEKAIPLVQG